MPVTRARTSASFDPAVCPTYSKVTGKDAGWTLIVVTSGGGKPPMPPGDCGCPQPAAAARSEDQQEQ
jgi:hypothetical protein